VKLYAPADYWTTDRAWILEVTNGCGARKLGWMVSDRLWGLKVTEACRIHDWMYHHGQHIRDKDEADRVFLNNLNRLINGGTRYLKLLRRVRALSYYLAVRFFGGPAFWSGKNRPEEMGSSTLPNG